MISLPSPAAAAAVASVRPPSITHQLSLFLNHSSSSNNNNDNSGLLQTTSFGGHVQSRPTVGQTAQQTVVNECRLIVINPNLMHRRTRPARRGRSSRYALLKRSLDKTTQSTALIVAALQRSRTSASLESLLPWWGEAPAGLRVSRQVVVWSTVNEWP